MPLSSRKCIYIIPAPTQFTPRGSVAEQCVLNLGVQRPRGLKEVVILEPQLPQLKTGNNKKTALGF